MFLVCRAELQMSMSGMQIPPTSPEATDEGDADWKAIQKNVFTRWCNERLKVVKIPVEELPTDLQDGTKMVALVQVLSHKMVGRYNKKPRIFAQKMENVQLALDLLTKVEKIKIVNIGKQLNHVHTLLICIEHRVVTALAFLISLLLGSVMQNIVIIIYHISNYYTITCLFIQISVIVLVSDTII